MIRKIMAIYIACFSLTALSMEETINQETPNARALDLVTSLIDTNFPAYNKKFPDIQNHKTCYFEAFVKDLKNELKTNENIYPLICAEVMQQYIVSAITDKMSHHHYKNNGYVANQLAAYDDSFTTVCSRIEDAFIQDKPTHSAWYANATKMFATATGATPDHYGYDGGTMTPLSLATKQADFNWFGRLLAEGANPNKTYPTVNYGITHVLYEVIQLKDLLKRTYNPKKTSVYHGNGGTYTAPIYLNTPALYKKIKSAYCSILCLLLKHNVDVALGHTAYSTGAPTITPLALAIHAKDTHTVLALLETGARLSEGDTKLLDEKELEWFHKIQ